MPSGSEFINALKQEGGCSLFVMAVGAIMVVGFLYYFFIAGGSPENKKFREECWDRYSRKYWPGDVPDEATTQIVIKCEKELRAHLGLGK
jgi:hypothetical protein